LCVLFVFFWLCCVCGVEPLFWFRSFVWSKAPWACCTCLCCQSYSRKCFCLRTFVRSEAPWFFGICVLTPKVFWLRTFIRSNSPLGMLHLFVQFFFLPKAFLFQSFVRSKAPWFFWHLCFNTEGVLASNLRKVEKPLGCVALVCAVFFRQRCFCFDPLLGRRPLGFVALIVHCWISMLSLRILQTSLAYFCIAYDECVAKFAVRLLRRSDI